MTDTDNSGTITEKLLAFNTDEARQKQAEMFQVIVNQALPHIQTDVERKSIDATFRAFQQGELDFFNTKARFERLVWALGGENKRKDFRRRRIDCNHCGLLIPYAKGETALKEHCSDACLSATNSARMTATHEAHRQEAPFAFNPGALPPLILPPLAPPPAPVTSLAAAAEAAGLVKTEWEPPSTGCIAPGQEIDLSRDTVIIGEKGVSVVTSSGDVRQFRTVETEQPCVSLPPLNLPPLDLPRSEEAKEAGRALADSWMPPALNLPPLSLPKFEPPPQATRVIDTPHGAEPVEPDLPVVLPADALKEAGIALAPSTVGFMPKAPALPKLRRRYSAPETVLHRAMKIALDQDPDWHLEKLREELLDWPKTEIKFKFDLAEGGGSYVLCRKTYWYDVDENCVMHLKRESTTGCALHRNVYITGEFGVFDSITIENVLRDYCGLPVRDPANKPEPVKTTQKEVGEQMTRMLAGQLKPTELTSLAAAAEVALHGEGLPPDTKDRMTIGELATLVNEEDPPPEEALKPVEQAGDDAPASPHFADHPALGDEWTEVADDAGKIDVAKNHVDMGKVFQNDEGMQVRTLSPPLNRCRYCAMPVEQAGKFYCDAVCERLGNQ